MPIPERLTPEPNPEQTPKSASVPSQIGTVQQFVYRELALEVSNVCEIEQGHSFDGATDWEYDIYVVYPGATMTILNAGMWEDEASGSTYADWAISTVADEKIYIVDNMEPLEITSDVFGVFDPESSVYVLAFEICEENE